MIRNAVDSKKTSSPKPSPFQSDHPVTGETNPYKRIAVATAELIALLSSRQSRANPSAQDSFMLDRVAVYLKYYRRQYLQLHEKLAGTHAVPVHHDVLAAVKLLQTDIQRRSEHADQEVSRLQREQFTQYRLLCRWLEEDIPKHLGLSIKAILDVTQRYKSRQVFLAKTFDAVNRRKPPESDQAPMDQRIRRLINFLKRAHVEALSRVKPGNTLENTSKPESQKMSKQVRKAADFILKRGESGPPYPKGAQIANHLGIDSATFRNHYVPFLKKNFGLSNEGGYFFPADSKIHESGT